MSTPPPPRAQWLIRLTIAFVLVVAYGCAEESSPRLGSGDGALTWFTRNADTIRDQIRFSEMSRADATDDASFDQSLREFVAAQHARGAGDVAVPALELAERSGTDVACDDPYLSLLFSRGSGTLVSDSRLLTNIHVAFPAKVDMNEDGGCGYLISFESRRVANTNLGEIGVVDGASVAYDPNNAINTNNWEDTTDNKSTLAGEESPLLANRLFQLGLETWATDDSTGVLRRTALRAHWPFRPDTGEFSAAPTGGIEEDLTDVLENLEAAFLSQGFVSLVEETSPPHRIVQGLDVAFLAACQHDGIAPTANGNGTVFSSSSSSAAFTPSGPFGVDRPAVFFDRVDIDLPRYADGVSSSEATRPLELIPSYVVHTNRWADDTSTQHTQIVSRPGHFRFLGAEAGCGNSPSGSTAVITKGYCWNRAPETLLTIEPEDNTCIQLGADYRVGSSGGGVLQRQIQVYSDPVRAFPTIGLYLAAIVQGASPSTAAWTGRSNFDAGASESAWLAEATAGSAVAVNAAMVTWGGRDHATDASSNGAAAPTPWKPDGGVPSCSPADGVADCEAGDYEGDPLDETNGISFSDLNVTGGPTPPPDEGLDGRTAPSPPDTDTTLGMRFWCNNPNESGTSNDGMAVGLLGAQINLAGQTPGVGSLRLVCAPWSSRPYTDNWRFLYAIGRTVHPDADAMVVGYSWYWSMLHRALPYMFEVREDDRLHPVSMKLCPPNFVMVGYRGRIEGDTLLGFTHLLCERPTSNPAPSGYPSRVCVALSPEQSGEPCTFLREGDPIEFASAAEHGGSSYDGFTLSGESFGLDQRIGDPTREVNHAFLCADGRAIAAFRVAGTNGGPVTTLIPECVDMP